jgi:NADPH2:quinone reductase
MGANNVVIHSDGNWKAEVKDITAKKGVDIVFEHVGKATWKQSLSVLSKGGRIVTCGATTGQNVSINLAHLFIKQHSILGSTMSSLPTFNEVMQKIHKQIYFPFVDDILRMENIRKAHEYIEKSQHNGKVVMVFDL